MSNAVRKFLLLFTVLVVLSACTVVMDVDSPPGEGRLRVVTSITPITNIVYNIGGDRIELSWILPPGADPHTYEPAPSDAVKLAQADIIFVNGMHLDESTLRLAKANVKEGAEIVELAVVVAEPDEWIYGQEHFHGHGEEEGHDEDGHDEEGHDEDGHDEEGHDENGHDEDGHDEDGHDEEGHDEDGHDEEGHDEEGHDEDGHDHDEEGHDEEGHDENDHDENGHDEEGHDEEGHDEEGHDEDDHDENGHDEEGHDEEGHDEDGHDEDGHDEEDESARDPHLMLDPNFVMRYAKVALEKLAERDPENGAYYRANYEEYIARLQALDEAIRSTTATIPEENRRLLTFHDSFGYFARQYGYVIVGAIQPSDTSEPSAMDVAAWIEQLREEGLPAVFGSALFPAAVLEQIGRETGAEVRTLQDDGLPGEPGDHEHSYIGMMVENMRTLASSLGGDPSLMDGVEVGNVPDSEE